MKNKYQILIEQIESLSSEIDFDRDGQMIELEHKYISKSTDDSCIIEIEIRRPQSITLIKDSFLLNEKNENIEIRYCRNSLQILPIAPKSLPDTIERIFVFDKNENQSKIFKELMDGIVDFFEEFNYEDQNYKLVSKYAGDDNLMEDDNNEDEE